MQLKYLDFDYSEDTEGVCTFDAMASTSPQHVAAVHAEIAKVLAWACKAFGDQRGALEDGFEWDYDLQSQRDYTVSEALEFDCNTGRLGIRSETTGVIRHTTTLSISGSQAFAGALRDRFDLG